MSEPEFEEVPAAAPASAPHRVTASEMNVRDAPFGRIITTVPRDHVVHVTELTNGWARDVAGDWYMAAHLEQAN